MPRTTTDSPQQGSLIGQVKDSIGSGLFLLLPLTLKKKNVGTQTKFTRRLE